jgi:phosphohistidine phosphatase SixA
MKRLFLMRHGHSPTPAESGVKTDAQRPLSELGREQAARMAAELKKRGARPAFILHSPLLRATQTAQVAALGLETQALVFEALDNTLPAEDAWALLAERGAKSDDVLAIGHQPQIGEIASMLTGQAFEIRPAGAVAVDVSEVPKLIWCLNDDELA